MIEEFLGKLVSPIRALLILSKLQERYLDGDIDLFYNESEREFKENEYSIIYTIQLVSEDIMNLRKEYYKKMKDKKNVSEL